MESEETRAGHSLDRLIEVASPSGVIADTDHVKRVQEASRGRLQDLRERRTVNLAPEPVQEPTTPLDHVQVAADPAQMISLVEQAGVLGEQLLLALSQVRLFTSCERELDRSELAPQAPVFEEPVRIDGVSREILWIIGNFSFVLEGSWLAHGARAGLLVEGSPQREAR